MGRRATSTTKGGRYMNPADQERKMARKKELKKNKKQRHMVRQAVLKSKDPSDLLVQMEKLDEMEFSDYDAKPLSERVIQEKRNKLRETYVRVLSMYKRENEMEKFTEMKRELQAYDHKRTQLHQQFIAQKFAREVNPAEIPLPDSAPPPPEAAAAMTPAAALANRGPSQTQPFPPHLMLPELGQFGGGMPTIDFAMRSLGAAGKQLAGTEQLHSILKKNRKRSTYPPGPPIGVPSEMSDSSDEDDDHEDVQQLLAMRRVDADERGEEDDMRKRRAGRFAISEYEETIDDEGDLSSSRSARVRFDDGAVAGEPDDKDSRTKYKELAKKIERGEVQHTASRGPDIHASGSGPSLSSGRPGAAIPPPPSLSMVGPGAVGGPPQLMRQAVPAPALGSLRPGMRMPPPPPPGFPPSRMQRPPAYVGHVPGATTAVAAVLSAPPAINKPKQANAGAVIEAKPQLRNMQQEVTKLVPTAVKVRREQQVVASKKPKGPLIFRTPEAKISVPGSSVQHAPQKSTDEAYDEFMKELHTLL